MQEGDVVVDGGVMALAGAERTIGGWGRRSIRVRSDDQQTDDHHTDGSQKQGHEDPLAGDSGRLILG